MMPDIKSYKNNQNSCSVPDHGPWRKLGNPDGQDMVKYRTYLDTEAIKKNQNWPLPNQIFPYFLYVFCMILYGFRLQQGTAIYIYTITRSWGYISISLALWCILVSFTFKNNLKNEIECHTNHIKSYKTI